MRTLDTYISKSFLKYTILVTLILMVLFSLVELLSQLDDVGKGTYQLQNAFAFTALTLPKRLLELMPISALLGGILALGLLADRGELVAMGASGISNLRISIAVLVTGTLLMFVAGILAEMVVPGMEQLARRSRSQALSQTSITLTQQGFWARMGDSYIHVDHMLSHGVAADIDIFEFADTGQLQIFSHAQKAQLQDNGQWTLSNITRKIIENQAIITRTIDTLTLDFSLNADQVSVLELPPGSLSIPDLRQYIAALRQSGQNADHQSIALWRKFTIPLTTAAMVLLSLSFVFGPTRSTGAGYRITAGTLIGIVLYFSDQMIMQWGLLLNLTPLVITLTPVILISGIALAGLRRVR